ncbi:hypothetical protein BJF90_11920 [Pseudonocardia sp. CNS-004]|nr:hypothetical protein BJF90_11920 [Pseudonocardia sp. CNS-004]
MLPNVAFLVGYELVGASAGVVAALAAAQVLVGVQLLRRNKLTAAAAGFGLVVLHTAMVVLTGEGRDYFLPWLMFIPGQAGHRLLHQAPTDAAPGDSADRAGVARADEAEVAP